MSNYRTRNRRNRQIYKKRGNCYVASEALYHILGGKAAGWVPMCIPAGPGRPDTHWFLMRQPWKNCPIWALELLDPSRLQFGKNPPPYHLARGTGFLTKRPSKRARILMEKLTWQD